MNDLYSYDFEFLTNNDNYYLSRYENRTAELSRIDKPYQKKVNDDANRFSEVNFIRDLNIGKPNTYNPNYVLINDKIVNIHDLPSEFIPFQKKVYHADEFNALQDKGSNNFLNDVLESSKIQLASNEERLIQLYNTNIPKIFERSIQSLNTNQKHMIDDDIIYDISKSLYLKKNLFDSYLPIWRDIYLQNGDVLFKTFQVPTLLSYLNIGLSQVLNNSRKSIYIDDETFLTNSVITNLFGNNKNIMLNYDENINRVKTVLYDASLLDENYTHIEIVPYLRTVKSSPIKQLYLVTKHNLGNDIFEYLKVLGRDSFKRFYVREDEDKIKEWDDEDEYWNDLFGFGEIDDEDLKTESVEKPYGNTEFDEKPDNEQKGYDLSKEKFIKITADDLNFENDEIEKLKEDLLNDKQLNEEPSTIYRAAILLGDVEMPDEIKKYIRTYIQNMYKGKDKQPLQVPVALLYKFLQENRENGSLSNSDSAICAGLLYLHVDIFSAMINTAITDKLSMLDLLKSEYWKSNTFSTGIIKNVSKRYFQMIFDQIDNNLIMFKELKTALKGHNIYQELRQDQQEQFKILDETLSRVTTQPALISEEMSKEEEDDEVEGEDDNNTQEEDNNTQDIPTVSANPAPAKSDSSIYYKVLGRVTKEFLDSELTKFKVTKPNKAYYVPVIYKQGENDIFTGLTLSKNTVNLDGWTYFLPNGTKTKIDDTQFYSVDFKLNPSEGYKPMPLSMISGSYKYKIWLGNGGVHGSGMHKKDNNKKDTVKKVVGGALSNNSQPVDDEIYKKKSILLLQKMRVLSMKKIGSISTFDEVNSNVYLFNLI